MTEQKTDDNVISLNIKELFDNSPSSVFYYISDIHIDDRLSKLEEDAKVWEKYVLTVTDELVANISNEHKNNYILIAGDISNHIVISELFFHCLKKSLADRTDVTVISILGNHEFWDKKFRENKSSVDEVIYEYRKIAAKYGFYFLHNDIFCKIEGKPTIITEQEIFGLSAANLREKLINATDIILGSIAYSSEGKIYTAKSGLYYDLEIVNEIFEKILCNSFRNIYYKYIEATKGMKTIVMTHMGVIDWLGEEKYEDDKIYIAGHTHRNRQLNNGSSILFQDNQIGHSGKYSLKAFTITDDGTVLKRALA